MVLDILILIVLVLVIAYLVYVTHILREVIEHFIINFETFKGRKKLMKEYKVIAVAFAGSVLGVFVMSTLLLFHITILSVKWKML